MQTSYLQLKPHVRTLKDFVGDSHWIYLSLAPGPSQSPPPHTSCFSNNPFKSGRNLCPGSLIYTHLYPSLRSGAHQPTSSQHPIESIVHSL